MQRAHLWTWGKPEFCIFRDGPSVTTMKWQGVTMQTLGRGSRSGGSCFSCLLWSWCHPLVCSLPCGHPTLTSCTMRA